MVAPQRASRKLQDSANPILLMLLITALCFYCSWQLYPRWTILAGLVLGLVLLGLTSIRALLRGTSLRTMVLLFPIVVAILCIPARRFVAARQLRGQLFNCRVTQFDLRVHQAWHWIAQSLGTRQLDDQLVKMQLDLSVADQSAACRLPQDALIYLVILRGNDGPSPTRELAEWIHGCRSLRAVDLRLGNFTNEDLQWISSLQVPCRLSIQKWEVDQRKISLPTVTHLSLSKVQLDQSLSKATFAAPKLHTLKLSECAISEGQILNDLQPNRRLELIRCGLSSPSVAGHLFSLSTRVISLTELRVPEVSAESLAIRWPVERPNQFGLMLFSCQFAGDALVDIVQRKQPDELLIRGGQPLSVSQFDQVLQTDRLRHLVLEGPWLTREHLTALSTVSYPLKLELADFALPKSDELWIREQASPKVKLLISNRILPSAPEDGQSKP